MHEVIDAVERRAKVVLERYESSVRAELEALGSPLLPELDDAAAMLGAALRSRREVRVGFLGESQVGKSTLINALVGARALPSGGVGPLTAQATRLRYAGTPALSVTYHDRQTFNRFLLPLRQYLIARGELAEYLRPNEPEESSDDIAELALTMTVEGNELGAEGPARNPMGEYLVERARLMLGATSDLPPAVLHDAMRAVLELAPLGDSAPLEPYRPRIAELRDLLGRRIDVFQTAETARAFSDTLRLNATGWASPLVAEIDLALTSDLLARVEVVDLPGVGVVGDAAGRVAEEFVRDDASALVIVARNNGLTHEVVGLLERTGIVKRMLFGGDASRTSPIHVVFAITRLDDVAKDHWKRERDEAKASGQPMPGREAVFARLAAEMEQKAKEQVRSVLQASPLFDDLSPEQRARREQVVADLCDAVEVICVSSNDFVSLESDDEEDREMAFLRNKDATNIPLFRERLAELAERARGSRRGRITRAFESFRGLLDSHVAAIALSAANRSPTTAGNEFRNALDEVVPSYAARATARRRVVTSHLNERIPPQLDALTQEAAARARKQLAKLRKHGEGLHWASLNAALVRNGTWDKQGIDYAGRLTMSFVEVIATAWEPTVLSEVRTQIRGVVAHHVDLVDEFLAEASKLAGAEDLLGQIQAQQRVLKEQGKTAVAWTAEQLDELNEDVRKKLDREVLRPIERACAGAVKAGANRGSGARTRILEVFQSSGNDAIERAREASLALLTDRFEQLRRSLGRLLRENEDPISQCYEAIVQQGERLAEEAARVERQRIGAAVARIRAQLEVPDAVLEEVPSADPPPSLRPVIKGPVSVDRPGTDDIFGDLGEGAP